jgi:hypothetical protein
MELQETEKELPQNENSGSKSEESEDNVAVHGYSLLEQDSGSSSNEGSIEIDPLSNFLEAEDELPQDIGDIDILKSLPSEKQLNTLAMQQFDQRYNEDLQKYLPGEGISSCSWHFRACSC